MSITREEARIELQAMKDTFEEEEHDFCSYGQRKEDEYHGQANHLHHPRR